MLHKVKDNKDVILDGKIYKCGKDGIVDLPRTVTNADIKPLEEDDKKPTRKGNK